VIVVLVLLGQMRALLTREQTGGAIRALLDLAPQIARRLPEDGPEEEVPLAAIVAGDSLRLHPDDKVPLDGKVLEGGSNVDERVVTGEAVPVARAVGDQVIGGTLNGRAASSCGKIASAMTWCRRRSSAWAQVRSARGHRSSEWPTRSKAGSCRRLWRPPHLLSPRGRSGGQNHGSLTRWWRQ